MQGFYFSKPVAPDDLAQLLRQHQATPAAPAGSGCNDAHA
jgi:hypothetical protein